MINRQNWLDVKDFLAYQQNTLQNDPLTVSRLWKGLRPALIWADDRLFSNARMIDPTLPAYFVTAKTVTSKTFSPTGSAKNLQIARQFFTFARKEWPARYKNITESWVQTLQPSKRNSAQSRLKDHAHFELDDVLKITALEPANLEDKRDIAAVAFLFLSGMRIGAFTSLPIECVNVQARQVRQLPEKGVMTKNRKAAVTYLLPITPLLDVITSWDIFLRENLSPSDLWYSVLKRSGDELDKGKKSTYGRHRNFNCRLAELCNRANIPYLSAHKLRHGHVVYSLKNVKDMAGLKAVSQNVMHASVSITDGIYGNLSGDDIQRVISGLGTGQTAPQSDAIQAAAALLSALQSNPEILKLLTAGK